VNLFTGCQDNAGNTVSWDAFRYSLFAVAADNKSENAYEKGIL
jgi:hypothetical protein